MRCLTVTETIVFTDNGVVRRFTNGVIAAYFCQAERWRISWIPRMMLQGYKLI